jgi:hypothetical protein
MYKAPNNTFYVLAIDDVVLLQVDTTAIIGILILLTVQELARSPTASFEQRNSQSL